MFPENLPALLAAFSDAQIQEWLTHAFYPMLAGILIIASLGVPIPEDVPLIASGIVLHQHPGVATWLGTIAVATTCILSGDMLLYTLGRRWGRTVFNHRSVSWLITPARMAWADRHFHRYGIWMVFFGRMVAGVRAVMCITAGVTRLPFHRFFLADLAGALVSVPTFIALGYAFAGALPTLRRYVLGAQGALLVVAIVVIGIVVFLKRKALRRAWIHTLASRRRHLARLARKPATPPSPPRPQQPAADA